MKPPRMHQIFYRGYTIEFNPVTGVYRIMLNNEVVETTSSEIKACALIDEWKKRQSKEKQ